MTMDVFRDSMATSIALAWNQCNSFYYYEPVIRKYLSADIGSIYLYYLWNICQSFLTYWYFIFNGHFILDAWQQQLQLLRISLIIGTINQTRGKKDNPPSQPSFLELRAPSMPNTPTSQLQLHPELAPGWSFGVELLQTELEPCQTGPKKKILSFRPCLVREACKGKKNLRRNLPNLKQ